MTALTQQLRDNTQAFLQGLIDEPLIVSLDGSADGQVNDPNALRQTSAHPDGTVRAGTIRGLDRVAWAAIEREFGYHGVKIYTTHPGPGAEVEPCYWLPWKENATVRIKLKPTKKLENDIAFGTYQDRYREQMAIADHAQARRMMLQGLAEDERSPRLFFTAMLTGCSVHIEGETNAPNVMHSNASRMGAALGTYYWRFQHYWRMSSIDGHLVTEYQQVATPGAPNVGHLGPYYGYDYRMWGNPNLAPAWGHGTEFTGPNTEVKKMLAAVFGVRTGENWEFYGQRVYVYKPDGQPQRRLGTAPRRIWPGAGTLQI